MGAIDYCTTLFFRLWEGIGICRWIFLVVLVLISTLLRISSVLSAFPVYFIVCLLVAIALISSVNSHPRCMSWVSALELRGGLKQYVGHDETIIIKLLPISPHAWKKKSGGPRILSQTRSPW
jgi:hypothetical protein